MSVKVIAEESGGTWLKLWTALEEAVRTGKPVSRQVFGDEWWAYLRANPKEMETFGEAMKSNSLNSLRGVLEKCDFSRVRRVVDVAGSFGHLVIALLEKYRNLSSVLLDIPDLIQIAPQRFPVTDPQIASRLEYVGGDMFESIPRADAFVLKHIIHDWDDADCLRILRNCHNSMEGSGRLICVDTVVPPMGDVGGTSAKLLDILMLVAIGGKERTKQQWEELYRCGGISHYEHYSASRQFWHQHRRRCEAVTHELAFRSYSEATPYPMRLRVWTWFKGSES